MIAADRPDLDCARLLAMDETGALRRLPRRDLATLFRPGDVVIANDAATLPASLAGRHIPTGARIEIRLAGWVAPGDPLRFLALAFGTGDWRQRTEARPLPPPLTAGDLLALGPLTARVEQETDHPRLVVLRFLDNRMKVLEGLARHGRPIQYAHLRDALSLRDVWTPIAARPIAFEPPSAGFALSRATLHAWRSRGVGFVALTHAAGVSSTGDALLDLRLPFDEPYVIPQSVADAVARAKSARGRIFAVGTTVTRALEAAATPLGAVTVGPGVATGRLGRHTNLQIVDAILSGVHQIGESHYELLRAFADDQTLNRMSVALQGHGFRAHEFGDSVLLARQRSLQRRQAAQISDLPNSH
jgi:S-adenosylmethionine:tRNA ribosyltransferase-isomerase